MCLQENIFKTKELCDIVKQLGYKAESNFDAGNNKPGTAMIWSSSLNVAGPPQALEPRFLQVLQVRERGGGSLGDLTVVNVYAPTGSKGKQEREEL